VELIPEMTFTEQIVGPWGPTIGSPYGARLCWQVTEATLEGNRIRAHLVMPGADWIRLAPDGTRRQDLRLTFQTDDGATVMFAYDQALIRPTGAFTQALDSGTSTDFGDQYMRMLARFDTGDPRYTWLTTSLFLGEGRLLGGNRIHYRIFRLD
jgi:hypothetical protein